MHRLLFYRVWKAELICGSRRSYFRSKRFRIPSGRNYIAQIIAADIPTNITINCVSMRYNKDRHILPDKMVK